MKKILLASLILSLGTFNVQAATQNKGCLTLANTNWDGTVYYQDNTPVHVTVHVTTLHPNLIGYTISGTVDIGDNKGLPLSSDAVCSSSMQDPTTIGMISFIVNTSPNVVNLTSMIFDNPQSPSSMSNIFGKFNQNSINYGTIKKQ